MTASTYERRPAGDAPTTEELTAHLYHEECGYAWAVHDNRVQANRRPFGCPSEAEARAAYGDR
jgi:hypothetical protein